MEIPLEIFLIFFVMTFILFIITLFLLFIDVTVEKAVAALILTMFNFILCIIVSLSFAAIDLYSYDSSGAVVHNVYSELYPFQYFYWVFSYINFILAVYCGYLFIQKPIEENQNEREIQY